MILSLFLVINFKDLSNQQLIASLEMLASLVACYKFKNYLCETEPVMMNLFTDNSGCVGIGNKFYAKTEPLAKLFKHFIVFMIKNQIWIKFDHIPGKYNSQSDLLSRKFDEITPYYVNTLDLSYIKHMFEVLDISLE